jgi:hypothetical protein
MEGKSVHRATYCARNYPLPLLPSGPGGVGGITSRRTRHRNHFITQHSPPPTPRTRHHAKHLPTRFSTTSLSSHAHKPAAQSRTAPDQTTGYVLLHSRAPKPKPQKLP